MRQRSGAFKSGGERSTSEVLRKYFHGRPYVVLKDVALNQVLEPEARELPSEEFQFYSRASLDFLVCHDDRDGTFELAVEYDGQYHEDPRQSRRDEIKNDLCARAGLPLIRIGGDAVCLRGETTILEFILDQYFGEKAVAAMRDAGKLSSEDEYFAEFPETAAIQRRMMQKGLFPPVFALGAEGPSFHWWRVTVKEVEPRFGKGSPARVWRATTHLEIFKGPLTAAPVFHVTRSASLRDPVPGQSVPGVHGWHLASQLATFLCFYYVESEWLPI
jgi:hypothetical protein